MNVSILLCAALAGSLQSGDLRVLPEGRRPADARLAPPKDLDGDFSFEVPATREAWERRAEELRRRIRVATGLWPEPERTPLNVRMLGRAERPDFTVDRVAFESVPGHVVAGLLFRPKGKTGPFPAVLSPHGHEGRLWDYGEAGVRRMIALGQERFEGSGRFPQLARCAQLARMGCVAFIHDMLGYADSTQISTAVAHRFAKQRPDFDSPERWGFFGVQAEGRLQSILGLQVWNALRALDFLAGLPDVDAARIGVTGSSGGGTQTLMVCALDARPVVAFPQGMVSTAMQGGCTCENACHLRVGTGNVEFAALFAPKPSAMTAAKDWTREMMTKGYPELQRLYGLYGAKDKVLCLDHVHFPHNYNYVARAAMYAWFNRHLKLGLQEPILEPDFEPLRPEEARVWDAANPAPPGGDDVEAALLRGLAETSDRQLAALTPERRRGVTLAAWELMIGRGPPGPGAVTREKVDKKDQGTHWRFKDLLRVPAIGSELPAIFLHPKDREWSGRVVIWLDGAGKAGLFGPDGAPTAAVKTLLESGASILGADLLHQGEFLADGRPPDLQPVVKNPREYAGYTYGYNPTLFAGRVQDALALISFAANDEHKPRELWLVGANGAGPLAAAARALAGAAVSKAFIDTKAFRFARLKSYRDPDFLPGGIKYGDLPGLLALSAPHALIVAGESGPGVELLKAAYFAAGAPGALEVVEGPLEAALGR
jgi:dienelactone hydrolase